MRKEFYCIQSTNIIAKVQLYTDDIAGNGGFYAFTCIGEDKSGTGYSHRRPGECRARCRVCRGILSV